MALVERGRAGVHQDIVTGLLEAWVPWMRQELELVGSAVVMQQVIRYFLAQFPTFPTD